MRIAFDIGGTFTDFVLEDTRHRRLHFGKVPSTPSDPSRAVMAGLSDLLQRNGVAARDIDVLLHANTVAANAIIERKGRRTALIATKGFRDVVLIGRQKRYETYDLYLDKPKPLVRRRDVFELAERVLFDGTVEQAPTEAEVADLLDDIAARGYDSLAVCLLHAYAEPAHERLVARVAGERHPAMAVSLSSDVSAKFREYERTSTVVANAYVKPIVRDFVRSLEASLNEREFSANLFIMQSNGGLVSPDLACEKPVRIIESGPAAGVLKCAELGRLEGFSHVLTFDMGGTTAKLGAIDDGVPAIVPTFEIDQVRYRKGSGLPLNISAIELLEIGAGGGSIASTDMGTIVVGPESAGADPGPMAYGHGGTEPTVTDANVVLGYIDPDNFNGGAMRLDAEAAAAGIEQRIGRPLGLSLSDAAWGVYTMANSNMERAMRVVSVERGRDPRDYALIAFGGAGPLHAARLARALGIPKILVPYGAGVGSALGLLEGRGRIDHSITRVLQLRPEACSDIVAVYDELEQRVRKEMANLPGGEDPDWLRFAYMRYEGQGYEIRVDLPVGEVDHAYIETAVARFREGYRKVFGYDDGVRPIEVVDWYLMATARARVGADAPISNGAAGDAGPARRKFRQAYFPEAGGYTQTAIFDRARLSAGEVIKGPAIVEERESTTVILPGDSVALTRHGSLVITAGGAQ